MEEETKGGKVKFAYSGMVERERKGKWCGYYVMLEITLWLEVGLVCCL